MSKLCSAYFSSNGSFTVPAGVTKVIIIGHGGGAGGSGGRNATNDASFAGRSTTPYAVTLTVVPNTTYTITIGAGGTGGIARTTQTQNGGIGGDTTFGALKTFLGASVSDSFNSPSGQLDIGHTAPNGFAANVITSGLVNLIQTSGTSVSSYQGGRGGVCGYTGSTVGAGGNANAAGVGGAATTGTGFGYGGAGGGAGSSGGGVGSAGGPGQLWVIWVE